MSIPTGEITRMLSEAVGPDQLSSSAADTTPHGLDFWPRRLIQAREGRWPGGPRWVVWPGAAAEVSHVLRVASTYALPVIPFGAGSSMVGAAAPVGDRPWIVCNTKRMCNVLDLDEVSMVAHVQTGIVGVELEEHLNARGFSLGHMPTSMTNATLGGWLSTHSAGLLSSRYGRITDLCLGVTAVLPDGQVIHTRPAPRRATGPDLMHMLLGSEGTLGVITAAHLRLHRLPLHRQFDSHGFGTLEPAISALREILACGVRPLVARIQEDPRIRREVDGVVTSGQPATKEPPPAREAGAQRKLLIMAFDGPPELATAEQAVAQEIAARHGGEHLGPAPGRRWWGQRFAGGFRLGPLLGEPGVYADLADLGARWRDLAPLAARLTDALHARDLRVHLVIEHARPEGAALTCAFWGRPPEGEDPVEAYEQTWRIIAEIAHAQGGHLGHVFGIGRHRMELLDANTRRRLEMLVSIKRKLDPAGIMNPGVCGTLP